MEIRPYVLLVGTEIGAATTGNSMEVPPYIKSKTTIRFSNSAYRYLSEENANYDSKKYCTSVFTAASFPTLTDQRIKSM